MQEELINKVAQSGIITIDPEKYFPEGEIVSFDLKEFLFMELILKEKDFREQLKHLDWSRYHEKNVALFCSADVIVPLWAYMLAASYLQAVTKRIIYGSPDVVLEKLILENLSAIDPEEYRMQRVVVKGCGKKTIPPAVYIELVSLLNPVVKSIMFGEPCSTVPIYKRKDEAAEVSATV